MKRRSSGGRIAGLAGLLLLAAQFVATAEPENAPDEESARAERIDRLEHRIEKLEAALAADVEETDTRVQRLEAAVSSLRDLVVTLPAGAGRSTPRPGDGAEPRLQRLEREMESLRRQVGGRRIASRLTTLENKLTSLDSRVRSLPRH